MTTRLQERYETTVSPALMQEFGYKNPMQVPRLEKIVVNMGVGEAVQDGKKIDAAVDDLTAITGQQPVVIKAKQSIATFKLRQGMPIGVQGDVAPRAHVRVPRPADHRRAAARARFPRRLGQSFDGRGNYALGLKEQLVFPEIDYDKVDADARHGHRHRHDGARPTPKPRRLLKGFDMPFAN